MLTDRFPIASRGWRIISDHAEARRCARELCRWLAEELNASAAGIRHRDRQTRYSWEERTERIVPGAERGRWTRQFPGGESEWVFDGGSGSADHLNPVLDVLAEQWLQKDWSQQARRRASRKVDSPGPFYPGWVAVSKASRSLASRLPHICQNRRALLLIGETGSGKAHLARLIHRYGPEVSAPFSGPGRKGDEGTLFIADWRQIPPQEKRVLLADGRRLIAAVTPGPDLDSIRRAWNAVEDGLTIAVPPLRERPEDIPLLAGEFLGPAAADLGRAAPEISAPALEALRAYLWPGNIRELEETMIRTMGSLPGDAARIRADDLPPGVRGAMMGTPTPGFRERLAALEYEEIREELRRQEGNMTRTARSLGMTLRQVSWRLKKYGIDPGDFRSGREVEYGYD